MSSIADQNKVKEIKRNFKSFVKFKFLKEDHSWREVKLLKNNLLYLKKNPLQNINDSGLEDLGTDWMLEDAGKGNFRFPGRWAWLFRHYIWASRVPSFPNRRARVLDVGCDVGEIRRIISRSFYTKNPYYLVVELDPTRIVDGFEKIHGIVPAIYVQHDVTLPMKFIKSNSVDLVYAGEVIEHFERKFAKKLLDEIHRVLKKKGRYMISTPNKNHTRNYDFHVQEYTVEEMMNMARSSGLSVYKTWGWITSERILLNSKDKGVRHHYRTLRDTMIKDIAVPVASYMSPEDSQAFCIEGGKV